MQIMENTDGSVPDTVSAWSKFTRIRTSEKVETTYEPTGIGREMSDGSPPRETCLSLANGPLILVCLVPKGFLPKKFDIESALLGAGIETSMAPNIAEHKNHVKYELVAVQSCVELLSTRLQGFKLIADYNPFAPAKDVERIYGIAVARKRARDITFAIAKKAKRRRWTPGSEECYRKVFAKAGLEREFDEEVLDRDIQGADAQALEQSSLDEGLSMTLPKVRETDQTIDESQLSSNNNIDHQDIGPPQDGKVDEFQEWVTVNKNDTEHEFDRTLTYLKEARKFGKRAGVYMTMLTLVENLPEMSPTYLNSINTQATNDYADLSNDFYKNALQNGQAVDCTQSWRANGREHCRCECGMLIGH